MTCDRNRRRFLSAAAVAVAAAPLRAVAARRPQWPKIAVVTA